MAADKASEPPAADAKKKAPPQELTAEDAELKANLELLVQRAGDADAGVQRLALENLRREIRSATRCVRAPAGGGPGR